MKKILLSLMAVAIFQISHGQTFENAYPKSNALQVINLSGIGYKYLHYDTASKSLVLNDSNHNVFKQIPFNIGPGESYAGFSCVSTMLFDNDPGVEAILFGYSPSAQSYVAYFVNEDGTLFHNKISNILSHGLYKFGNAWKLRITDVNYTETIYGLPGYIESTGIKPEQNEVTGTSIYPNPLNEAATIDYQLPSGINQGIITIYNSAGVVIKTIAISNNSNSVMIERGQLPAGVYHYSISAPGLVSVSKSFVVN